MTGTTKKQGQLLRYSRQVQTTWNAAIQISRHPLRAPTHPSIQSVWGQQWLEDCSDCKGLGLYLQHLQLPLHNCVLINSRELSPSRQANSRSVCQEILGLKLITGSQGSTVGIALDGPEVGIRVPVRARFSHVVHTDSGVHPAFYPLGTAPGAWR